jgi:hypothetical protein
MNSQETNDDRLCARLPPRVSSSFVVNTPCASILEVAAMIGNKNDIQAVENDSRITDERNQP